MVWCVVVVLNNGLVDVFGGGVVRCGGGVVPCMVVCGSCIYDGVADPLSRHLVLP